MKPFNPLRKTPKPERHEAFPKSIIGMEVINDMTPEQITSAMKALRSLVEKVVDPTGNEILFDDDKRETLGSGTTKRVDIDRTSYNNSRSETITCIDGGTATVVSMGEDLNYPGIDELSVARYNLGRLTTQELTGINRPFLPQDPEAFVEGYTFWMYGALKGECTMRSLETQASEPKTASYMMSSATSLLQDIAATTESLR